MMIFQSSLIATGSLGGSESRDKWRLSHPLSLMREQSLRVGVSNPGHQWPVRSRATQQEVSSRRVGKLHLCLLPFPGASLTASASLRITRH